MTVITICHSYSSRTAARQLAAELLSCEDLAIVLLDAHDAQDSSSDTSFDPDERMVRVVDATPLQLRRVHLLPKGHLVRVRDGVLEVEVEDVPSSGECIDHFLVSLAGSMGNAAVCVLLGGINCTNTLGVHAIRAAGGLIIAQRDEADDANDLIAACRAAGLIDHLAPLSRIATVVTNHVSRRERADENVISSERSTAERSRRMLAELANLLLPATSLTQIMEAACRVVATVLRVPCAAVLQRDGGGHEIRPGATIGFDEHHLNQVPFADMVQTLSRRALRSSSPIIVADLCELHGQDAEQDWRKFGLTSAVAVPIPGESEPFGVVVTFAREPDHFTDDDAQFLGAVAGILGQTAALQHRQQTLDDLRRRYDELYENAPDMIVAFDVSDGSIVHCNETTARVLGYPKEQVIGSPIFRFLKIDSRQRLRELIRRYRRQTWLQGQEHVLMGSDGRLVTASANARLIRDSSGRIISHATLRDITLQKAMEHRLMQLSEALERRVAQQTDRVVLLHDIAMAANETTSVREMMQFTVDRVCQALNCAAVHIFVPMRLRAGQLISSRVWRVADPRFAPLRDQTGIAAFTPGDSAVGQVYRSGRPMYVPDLSADPRWAQLTPDQRPPVRGVLVAPVLVRRQVAAVLEVFCAEPIDVDDRLLHLLVNVGTHLGRVIERKRWEKELADAMIEQQRHFGQELHDGVGQELTGLGYLARTLERRLQELRLPESQMAGQLVNGIQNALVHVRAMSRGMFPVELDDNGLMSALHELAANIEKQYGIRCRFICEAPVRVYDNSVAIHLFRIAQEAVNNAVKHGRARHVELGLSIDQDQITLTIANDGVPYEPNGTSVESGIGLRTMRYRAGIIGADFQIRPGDKGGTVVTCILKQEDLDSHVR